ncbi:MAG: N-acetyl-gamma-glutamyl-phosphate reductase, partial [Terriglobia bacterium]
IYTTQVEREGVGTAVEQEIQESRARGREPRAKVRVAVLGATGYAGRELIGLLARHPGVRLTHLMSSGRGGGESHDAGESHPALRGISSVPITPLATEALAPSGTDFVFLATPHEVSRDLAPVLIGRGLRVVDLSGAFRLKDAAAYPRWYGFEHHETAMLAEAVYGLPELNAGAIRNARLVANPGCYPTAAILALAPLLRAGIVDLIAGVICDAKSGATGAGRSLRDDLLFANVSENCRAYGIFTHRHWPEMMQALGLPEDAFTFAPHLLPVARGILSTHYLRLSRRCGDQEILGIFQKFYADAPLVRIYDDGKLPEILAVAHTQYADIGFALEAAGRRLVVVSAIDNLGKGAAGQAVQNMNLMLGFAEDTALV